MTRIDATLLLLVLFSLPRRATPGPVINANFPDPSILQVNGTSYAFSTNAGGKNIQVATAGPDGTWTLTATDALPVLGGWATTGKTWAPDVVDRGDGTFVMYYAAHSISPDTQCVGTATATSPTGPYTPQDTPFACPGDEGGAIDPAGFRDEDGSRWGVYKVDGNSLGGGGACGNADGAHGTPIRLQQFASDGITPVADPVTILDRGRADGPLVGAPSLMRRDGVYFLFFSSNCFNTKSEDVSYATAGAITGPYVRAGGPLLVTGQEDLTSPGGADVTADGTMMVFHANIGSGRGMFVAELKF